MSDLFAYSLQLAVSQQWVNSVILLVICYYCVCGFFVYCLFWTTAENSLSQTCIRFINKTKQVYMNKDMAKICANVGLNIPGNSFSRNYLNFCLFNYFLFIVMQTARALSLNILNMFSKFSFLTSSLL